MYGNINKKQCIARELAKPLHEEFIKNGWL